MAEGVTNVYIATLPRSGSTLLGLILGNHSKIFHIGESSYWGKISPKDIVCSCGKIGCEFLLAVEEQAQRHSEIKSIYEAYNIIDQLLEPDKIYHRLSIPSDSTKITSEIITTLHHHLHASCIGIEKLADIFRKLTGKEVIVDNTKTIRIAKYLYSRVGWKIILLARDPRGLAYSNKMSGVRKNVPRPINMKIPTYLDFAQRVLELGSQENVFFLKYEDLCANPETKIQEICTFLGISFEHQMLHFKRDKGHTIMGNRMRFNNSEKIYEDIGWIAGLTDEEKSLFYSNPQLITLYEAIGYKIVE